jgi:hypothetical protein
LPAVFRRREPVDRLSRARPAELRTGCGVAEKRPGGADPDAEDADGSRGFDRVSPLTGEASRPPTRASGDLHRNDEVDRNDDVIVDAWPVEPGLPDPWLIREREARRGHRRTEGRLVGQPTRVDDNVGVGRERLVRGQPPGGAQVHRLCPHEHHRIELLAKR